MSQDVAQSQQVETFREPSEGEVAGTMTLKPPPSAYKRYIDSQGIPVYRGIGIHDVRELELGPWDRLGVNAAFIDLDGTTDMLGMHVLEIPPGGSTLVTRQCYEEKFWVVQGEGSTELSSPGASSSQRFEWRKNSLFAIPMNVQFQLVNARPTPALLLAGNTAPPVINIFDDLEFVFGNNYSFTRRFDGSPGYYKPNTETVPTPDLGRAMWRTNIIPDIVDCDLPLDNQRSPGYRRIEPAMAGGYFLCFIGEHVPGRYSKAHAHSSGAVLICVKGEGFTFNWPSAAGSTPWADGKGDLVESVEYVQGGMVAAAPGGGNWFHQHFGSSVEPLRMLVFYGGVPGAHYAGHSLGKGKYSWINADIEDGGGSISYRNEDPFVRSEFSKVLARKGARSRMSPDLYL